MRKILVSWIGGNDLQACPDHARYHGSLGPILSTLKDRKFDSVYLLYNYPENEVAPYISWIKTQVHSTIIANYETLSSPVDFSDIYQAAKKALQLISATEGECKLSILLSPGTPAMQAVWILLGKTLYSVNFIQSSKEQGVSDVALPFDIAAEFLPDLAAKSKQKLSELMLDAAPDTAHFENILSNNPTIDTLKQKAAILAMRDVPVLIQGETGTGKELFARAIHNSSPRGNQKFIPINCGAIPKELIDSIFFGHAKGAFTGAIKNHKGVFEEADGGTLFLDEFGELPLDAQVRLLRVLQEGKIVRVGEVDAIKIDVRIIAATHKNLSHAIGQGTFREDLFYRVAIGILNLPPLRAREGDTSLLTDRLLDKINKDASALPGYKHKKISPKAKNIILKHRWPGNIRELHATLLRASLWPSGDEISDTDISESIVQMSDENSEILDREIGNGFDIQELIDEVEEYYVRKAWQQSGGRKKQAAELLGYNSYQTFDKRMQKLGIKT